MVPFDRRHFTLVSTSGGILSCCFFFSRSLSKKKNQFKLKREVSLEETTSRSAQKSCWRHTNQRSLEKLLEPQTHPCRFDFGAQRGAVTCPRSHSNCVTCRKDLASGLCNCKTFAFMSGVIQVLEWGAVEIGALLVAGSSKSL